MNQQPTESLDAPDGLLAQLIASMDGTTWLGLDRAGKPVRHIDPDDAEVLAALMQWKPPEEEPDD